MSDLYQPHSALELLQRFEGEAEARRHYLHERFERIREFDMQLEAMTAVPDPDVAMQALSTVRGPLGGLPVAIKDIFDTHDLVTALRADQEMRMSRACHWKSLVNRRCPFSDGL